ncbi:hypothetical protein E9993_19805 [Labilibacter sediminis]|nr:hypothetical protein E9993_19805 [Labilibacter sediminis]
MKTKKLITSIVMLFIVLVSTYAQDEWEPKVHLTGYVNTVVEYANLDHLDTKLGMGLSDAGFLASYSPIENLELKATLVYTHHIPNIQSLVVEAYGTYAISDNFKVGAGKFLTPLSPVNTYFYAPLNISVTLPMIVSHHFLLPQSISGFQVSGEFGDKVNFKYNLTYGNYTNLGHALGGILEVQGQEDITNVLPHIDLPELETQYLLGGSARFEASFQDVFSLGLNYFDGTQSTAIVAEELVPAKKYSWGVDGHLNLSGLKINGEYWKGQQQTTDLAQNLTSKYKGYYAEAMYQAGIFTPFVRYDFIEDINGSGLQAPTTAKSLGVAIRPIFETLFKIEYRKVNVDYAGGITNFYDFQDNYNHWLFSTVISF